MATINDLNISITQLDSVEAQALVKTLRESRRVSKKLVVSRKKSGPKKTKDVQDLIPLFTEEQKQQLLVLLEGE